MSYTKTLSTGEYKNIFELASQFKGNIQTKLASLKVMEKISKGAFDSGVEVDGVKQLPETITVEFSRNELEGYWKGIVGYISDPEISIEKVIIVKAIASSLGMSGRFTKLEENIAVSEDPIELD